jgi:opacity protein-like surface antigen
MITKLLVGVALAASVLLIPGTASAATPTLTAVATSTYPALDTGSGEYQQGFRKGYREGRADGLTAARDTCRKERRFGDHAANAGNDYDIGYTEGVAQGFETGFDWGYDRFCSHRGRR